MATPKRGPTKVDLTGTDGKKKLDVEWNEFAQKYEVKVRGRIQAITALQQIGNPQSRVSVSGSDRTDRMAEVVFGRYDRNRDGVLSGEEMQQLRGGSRYDMNADGRVTKQEMIMSLRKN